MNILTIDVDFLSSNYLHGLLARSVGGKITEEYWGKMLNEAGVPNVSANKHNLMYIINMFISGISKSEPTVAFGVYHDSILNHIPDSWESFNILNIDHHHDLYYSSVHAEEALKFNECSEANWTLMIGKRIKSYVWVGNTNSEKFTGQVDGFPIRQTTLSEGVGIAEDTKWDLIYVCLSPNYTASDHWFYFFMLVEMYKAYKGLEDVPIDSKRYTPLKEEFRNYNY